MIEFHLSLTTQQLAKYSSITNNKNRDSINANNCDSNINREIAIAPVSSITNKAENSSKNPRNANHASTGTVPTSDIKNDNNIDIEFRICLNI